MVYVYKISAGGLVCCLANTEGNCRSVNNTVSKAKVDSDVDLWHLHPNSCVYATAYTSMHKHVYLHTYSHTCIYTHIEYTQMHTTHAHMHKTHANNRSGENDKYLRAMVLLNFHSLISVL